MQRKKDSKEKQFEELVIDVKSVVKVNKGGRQRRYEAIVVVGDRKGKVGLGIGKANEIPDAIKKAIKNAKRVGNTNIGKYLLTDFIYFRSLFHFSVILFSTSSHFFSP